MKKIILVSVILLLFASLGFIAYKYFTYRELIQKTIQNEFDLITDEINMRTEMMHYILERANRLLGHAFLQKLPSSVPKENRTTDNLIFLGHHTVFCPSKEKILEASMELDPFYASGVPSTGEVDYRNKYKLDNIGCYQLDSSSAIAYIVSLEDDKNERDVMFHVIYNALFDEHSHNVKLTEAWVSFRLANDFSSWEKHMSKATHSTA